MGLQCDAAQNESWINLLVGFMMLRDEWWKGVTTLHADRKSLSSTCSP
jgi:hypothetical protein